MTKNPDKAVKLTKKDFASDQDVRWCPGCGDYAILAAVQKTLADMGVKREEAVFVSGIGCSSRFPYYMSTFGFHSIHGRAPSIATGLKLARPELSVWVITGDGDGLSIGGNHLLHALRRNVNLNIILFNNRIYGLTKGQYSPTSDTGTRTPSTPFGSVDYPVNPIAFAMGSGATFVARAIDVDAKSLGPILQRAHEHQGASIIEVLQNCPVFNDGVWNQVTDKATANQNQLRLEDGKPLLFDGGSKGVRVSGDMVPEIVEVGDGPGQVPESEIVVHREKGSASYHFMLSQLPEGSFPQPLGVLRCHEKPSYDALATAQVKATIDERGPGELEKLLRSGMTWEIGPDGKPIA
jgi:2-oxoglutarate ferredoxin oxidoreductase subunit beta